MIWPRWCRLRFEAVTRAAKIVCERTPQFVTAKASVRDMATDVDVSVEGALLGRGFPDANFLGEEGGLFGESDGKLGEDAEEKNRKAFAVTRELAANVQRIRILGSATIDLAWVAQGKLDATVILANGCTVGST
jgi:fructose-1,6-bisphosphatase/inositol monophosphatase family enzyme